MYRTAYARIKSRLCRCGKIQQHSFITQTRNVRPFLAKASCSQTSHCLQGDKQNACTWRVSKWETVYGPCLFSIQKFHHQTLGSVSFAYDLFSRESLQPLNHLGSAYPWDQLYPTIQYHATGSSEQPWSYSAWGKTLCCPTLPLQTEKKQVEESTYFPAKGTETQAKTLAAKPPNSHWNQVDLSASEDKSHDELAPESALGWACLNFLVRILTMGPWPSQSMWAHSLLSHWKGGEGHVLGDHVPSSLIQSSQLSGQEFQGSSSIPGNSVAWRWRSCWITLFRWSLPVLPT